MSQSEVVGLTVQIKKCTSLAECQACEAKAKTYTDASQKSKNRWARLIREKKKIYC
jgi:hypothetical protein